MGAYQLVRGLPAHAAVGETVEALGSRSPRAKGFVNANLRALTRLGPPWPESGELGVDLSYPDWIVERLTRDLGAADAKRTLAAMNEPAWVTLRPNARVATCSSLTLELGGGDDAGGAAVGDPARGSGVAIEPGSLVTDRVARAGRRRSGSAPPVAEGRATPQDEGSQAVVAALAPQPGERIADIAAAPGGKATAIAERVGPTGSVVALDLDAGRTRLVREAGQRLDLPWLQVGVADGLRPPLRPASFDRVLLDAPCSGIGVLRRRADARWRLTPEVIEESRDAATRPPARRRQRWCARVGCSSTRCARSRPRRPSGSTSSRPNDCRRSRPRHRPVGRGRCRAGARCCSRTSAAPMGCSCCSSARPVPSTRSSAHLGRRRPGRSGGETWLLGFVRAGEARALDPLRRLRVSRRRRRPRRRRSPICCTST